MGLLKACAGCGEPSTDARCPDCAPRDRKPSAQARGYDHHWNQLSKRARRLQPFCTDCGTTEDLQTDHSPEAWKRKAEGKPIRLADVAVVCGPCNRARGAARPGYVDPPSTSPDPRARQSPRLTPPALAADPRGQLPKDRLLRSPGGVMLLNQELSSQIDEPSDQVHEAFGKVSARPLRGDFGDEVGHPSGGTSGVAEPLGHDRQGIARALLLVNSHDRSLS